MDPIDRADECTVSRITDDGDLKSDVYSLVRYGSFERGDFLPGTSDLDYFLVVDGTDHVVDAVESILQECTRSIDHRGIDLAWEYRENLDDPYEGVPFKFLTVYQDDFRRHHSLVYGADVLAELPEYEFEAELPRRLDRIERLAAENADDPRAIRFLAGETARLLSRVDGSDSLRKDDVLATLEANDRTTARRIYRAYLDGRTDEFDVERLRAFVTDAVTAIRERRGDASP